MKIEYFEKGNFKVTGIGGLEVTQDFLKTVKNIFDTYGCCSVADIYDLCGYPASKELSKGGRYDFEQDIAVIHESENDFQVVFNKPVPLDKDKKPDMVAHPPHYQSKTGLEVIDVIRAFTADLKGIEATDTGNIIKYICRWNHKNGIEDLEKAQWYLNHLIEEVKNKKQAKKKTKENKK